MPSVCEVMQQVFHLLQDQKLIKLVWIISKLSIQQLIRKSPNLQLHLFAGRTSRQLWYIFRSDLRQTAQTPFQPSYQTAVLSTWVWALSRPPGGEWMVRRGEVTLKSWEGARRGRLLSVWMLLHRLLLQDDPHSSGAHKCLMTVLSTGCGFNGKLINKLMLKSISPKH